MPLNACNSREPTMRIDNVKAQAIRVYLSQDSAAGDIDVVIDDVIVAVARQLKWKARNVRVQGVKML